MMRHWRSKKEMWGEDNSETWELLLKGGESEMDTSLARRRNPSEPDSSSNEL